MAGPLYVRECLGALTAHGSPYDANLRGLGRGFARGGAAWVRGLWGPRLGLGRKDSENPSQAT